MLGYDEYLHAQIWEADLNCKGSTREVTNVYGKICGYQRYFDTVQLMINLANSRTLTDESLTRARIVGEVYVHDAWFAFLRDHISHGLKKVETELH